MLIKFLLGCSFLSDDYVIVVLKLINHVINKFYIPMKAFLDSFQGPQPIANFPYNLSSFRTLLPR